MMATLYAVATAGRASSGFLTWYTNLVMGATTPNMSVSWNASLPNTSVATCPVRAITGEESM